MSSVTPIVSTSSPHAPPHAAGMKTFHVIATNPAGWQSRYLDVPATDSMHARQLARAELAKTRCDDWDIELIVEAS